SVIVGECNGAASLDHEGVDVFHAVYPPEKEIDFNKKYPGKNGVEAAWRDEPYRDGEINNLAKFKPENNVHAVAYVYREIESNAARDLPISLGSDDTLTVWLNGQKVLAQNVARACAPDQAQLVLKLKPGKNRLLMKICQMEGDWAFYFASRLTLPPGVTWQFEDVSTKVGL